MTKLRQLLAEAHAGHEDVLADYLMTNVLTLADLIDAAEKWTADHSDEGPCRCSLCAVLARLEGTE